MNKQKVLKNTGFTLGIVFIVAMVTVFAFRYLDKGDKKEDKTVSNKLENNLDNSTKSEKEIGEKNTNEIEGDIETSSSETASEETTAFKPEERETPSQVQTPSNIVEMDKVMYGISSGNIRSGASTNHMSIGKLSYGQRVEVTGKDSEWFRINFNGQAAYVHESLLSENLPEQSQLQNTQPGQAETYQSQQVQQPEQTQQPETSQQVQQPEQSKPEQSQPEQTQPEQTQKPQQQPATVPSTSYVDEVIRLVNIERNNAGLSSLTKNVTLCQAAQTRATEIITVFDHTRPDGTSCFTVTDDYNIRWTAIGENIAKGQRSPQEVVEGWMNSPGHRANILNSNFNQIGVGVVQSGGYYYWTQLFIRSAQ